MRQENETVANQPPYPLLRLGPPTNRTWREQALTAAAQLRTLSEWLNLECPPSASTDCDDARREALDRAIRWHLDEATLAASRASPMIRTSFNGAVVERVLSHLDAAQTTMLLKAPCSYMQSQLPEIQSHVRKHLPKSNPHRVALEKVVKEAGSTPLDEPSKMIAFHAYRTACLEARDEYSRVRSFRNVLYVSAAVLIVLATLLATAGVLWPRGLSLCFAPGDRTVCPTRDGPNPTDVMLVEFFGLIAAAVSGAASLRRLNGTANPFGLPLALAILKLPAGALTSVLGLQLMRGGFVPGLSDLDNTPQIIAWAITFGAAQQLFTGLVDRQAQDVLDDVGGKTGTNADTPQ